MDLKDKVCIKTKLSVDSEVEKSVTITFIFTIYTIKWTYTEEKAHTAH